MCSDLPLIRRDLMKEHTFFWYLKNSGYVISTLRLLHFWLPRCFCKLDLVCITPTTLFLLYHMWKTVVEPVTFLFFITVYEQSFGELCMIINWFQSRLITAFFTQCLYCVVIYWCLTRCFWFKKTYLAIVFQNYYIESSHKFPAQFIAL